MKRIDRKTVLTSDRSIFEPQRCKTKIKNYKNCKNMEIINIEARTFEAMMTRFETFAEKVATLCRSNGEKTMQEWLDNQEACTILRITPRTLQTLRDNGTIPHTRIGSKMYYKPDDLKRLVPIVADRQKQKKLNNSKTA